MKKTPFNAKAMDRRQSNKAQAMQRLYKKLDEAQAAAAAGDKGISHKEMMRRVRARIKRRAQEAK